MQENLCSVCHGFTHEGQNHLPGDTEVDALADFFERLFVNDNSDKARAILTYFRELYGVDDDYISKSVEDLPEAPDLLAL